jgi:hypothetical protein
MKYPLPPDVVRELATAATAWPQRKAVPCQTRLKP